MVVMKSPPGIFSANYIGPVVRINPNDLHIANPHYFDEVFNATNGKADKPLRSAKAFGPYPAVCYDLYDRYFR